MNKRDAHNGQGEYARKFAERIGEKEWKRLRGKERKKRSLWYGLGLFGLVGWAVMIPTLIGIALGVWIDARWPGGISWTLTCMLIGVAAGCLNAWYWVSKERQKIEEERRE
jgi:ATP synthase protein I